MVSRFMIFSYGSRCCVFALNLSRLFVVCINNNVLSERFLQFVCHLGIRKLAHESLRLLTRFLEPSLRIRFWPQPCIKVKFDSKTHV